jgi:predicted Zn finger-like uncharacterized protein
MILTCPSCGTQYVVKDGAIPDGGRQVRCASCKHSWHQDPEAEVGEEAATEEAFLPRPANSGAAVDNASHERPREEDAPSNEVPGDEVVPLPDDDRPGDESRTDWFPQQDDDFSPFGQREEAAEERPRSPWGKLLLLALLVGALAAAFWFLAPAEWKARLGIAQGNASPLQLMLTHSQRQELASGNVLLAVTGRVINPTDETQTVPPIQAELRKTSGELVHSWTIAPPARSIPPGGRAPFNSAEMNVPPEGDLLTIAFRGSKA